MTGPRDGSALYAHGSAPGTVSAGPRSEALHAAPVGSGAQDRPAHSEPLHADRAPGPLAAHIRAQLADAYRAQATDSTPRHAASPTALPAAAAGLLARVTGRTVPPILPPAMRDPAADARAALHARPQLPQDRPPATPGPPAGPFTVPPALAGLIGTDRPRVIADAVRRHALAGRAQLAARIRAQATAAARLEVEREHAQEPPSSPGLTCTDAANPQVATPSGSPTNRRRNPDPTPTNRRQNAPNTPESSAQELAPGPCTACRTGCPLIGGPCCPHPGCDPQRIDDEHVPLCPVHDAPQERPQERPQPLDHGTRSPGRPPLPGEPMPAPYGPRSTSPRPHICTRPDACRHEPPQESPRMVTEHHAPGCPSPHPLGTLCHGYRPQEPAQDRPAGLPALSSFVELAGPQDSPQDVDERGPRERLADDVREAGTWTRNTVVLPVSRALLVDLGLLDPTPEERAALEAARAAQEAAQDAAAAPVRQWDAIRATQRTRSEHTRAQTAQPARPEA